MMPNNWRGQYLGQSGNVTANKEVIVISTAMWCDKGEHAFSAKDPDRQHFTKTETVKVPTGNSYGSTTYQQRQEITEELDICGPCWKSGNVFAPPKEVNGGPTLQDLEEKDREYREGYQAGVDHALQS